MEIFSSSNNRSKNMLTVARKKINLTEAPIRKDTLAAWWQMFTATSSKEEYLCIPVLSTNLKASCACYTNAIPLHLLLKKPEAKLLMGSNAFLIFSQQKYTSVHHCSLAV